MNDTEVSDDIRTRARFNLCQILKGSGINLGITIRGLTVSEDDQSFRGYGGVERKGKTHAIWKAHELMMQNVI